MGFTPEQKKEWYKNYAQNRAARRKAHTDAMVNSYQMRQSHDWTGEWIKTNFGAGGSFQKGKCKKCGIDYLVFKVSPCMCQSADKE